MPTLIVIGPELAVREYELKSTLSIGRHESNAIQLTEEKASRMHCSVRLEDGRAYIEDLNSANGVQVNGLRVSSRQLKHNDSITIGATTIVYCEKDVAENIGDTKVLVATISSQVNAIIPDSALPESFRNSANPVTVPEVPRSESPRSDSAPARAPRLTRMPVRSGGSNNFAVFAVGFLAVCAVGVLFMRLPQPVEAPSNVVATRPVESTREREKPIVEEPVPVPVPIPVPKPDVPQPVEEPTPAKPEPPPRVSLDEQLKAALAARDRALGSGNLLGAKGALQSFLTAVPPGQMQDVSALAGKRELDETVKIANAALELTLGQAREALAAKHFHLVSQRCTNLISNDPAGPFGAKAREMLERIDEQTAQVAESAKAKALDAVARGQIGEARAAFESVIGALAGTRWAGDIDTLHIQLIVTTGFLEKVEAARAAKAAAGAPVKLVLAAKKIEGTLVSLNGLQGRIRASQADLAFSIKNVETKDFIDTLNALGLSGDYAELACLWNVLGRVDAARAASEAALKKPGNIPIAATLAGLLVKSKNLHLYDFNGWRQQIDWEAVTGSWLTQDGKYVLETADGGETFLKPAGIGGPFPLDKARVSFEFEIRKPAAGWFFICELGNENQAVVLTFSATEVTLEDKTGTKSPPVKWTPDQTRVEISVDGDTVALALDGKPAATLEIRRIAAQKGTILFQARQCGCAIDNVILRSAE